MWLGENRKHALVRISLSLPTNSYSMIVLDFCVPAVLVIFNTADVLAPTDVLVF